MMATLREDSKRLYLLAHEGKTDEELNAIIRNNLLAVSYQNQYAAMRMFGEIDACNQILDIRTKKAEAILDEECRIEEAIWEWENSQEEMRSNAIVNLAVAASYHGQLVASILEEEDGLRAEEIRGWDEELTQMPDDTYSKLLKDLTSEGILATRNKKYYLLTPCTADLFPVNPIEWAKRVAEFVGLEVNGERINKLTDSQLRFLSLLVLRNQPATEYDWLEFAIQLSQQSINRSKEQRFPQRAAELVRLQKMGILSAKPVFGTKCNLYYFRMLGEEIKI